MWTCAGDALLILQELIIKYLRIQQASFESLKFTVMVFTRWKLARARNHLRHPFPQTNLPIHHEAHQISPKLVGDTGKTSAFIQTILNFLAILI